MSMREIWRRLVTLNRRDWLGIIGWAVLGLLLGVLCWPFIVGREVYQWRHYRLSRFEWEDVVRYCAVTGIMAVACAALLGPYGIMGAVGWATGLLSQGM